MKKLVLTAFCVGIAAVLALAQQSTFRDPLLDHLVGNWVLQGVIMGKQTTHDITAEWVLAHQYLRLHEVSREKKPTGQPEYEAMVFIGWDEKSKQYVCYWLDDFGAGYDNAVARATRNGNEIPFIFNYSDGRFHTTFVYDAASDTWEMRMDSENKGLLKPFARTKLTRK